VEEVIIRDREIWTVSPEGQRARMDLEEFARVFNRLNGQPGIQDLILPDGVKLVKSRGPMMVWVYEQSPRLSSLKWIAKDSPVPFGKRTKYRTVRIALPYLVVLAVFEKDMGDRFQLSHKNECYFRNEPIKSPKDALSYPALLNCSKFEPQEGQPLSWICTANMDLRSLALETNDNKRMRKAFSALLHCLLETGYNLSSEHHEASSWFTESTGVDPRVSTIEAWEKATSKKWDFVLDVPWLPTGFTLEGVVERIFQNACLAAPKAACSADFARILFNHARSE
jgi:hypothetical protein